MTTETAMTKEQIQIIQHSMGCDQYGRGGGHRNYFITDSTRGDGLICESLCEAGFMERTGSPSEITGGGQPYRVTAKGYWEMLEQSPKPPKLTRSQKRYQQWLDSGAADCGRSFADWIGAKRCDSMVRHSP